MKQEWIKRLDESLIRPFYEQQNDIEIEEGLTTQLSFGTAGIRGIFGIGPGRMNAFTVRKVALGIAQFFKSRNKEASIVVFMILDYFLIHFQKRFQLHLHKIM